jgi:hypothetical protein
MRARDGIAEGGPLMSCANRGRSGRLGSVRDPSDSRSSGGDGPRRAPLR